MYQNLRQKQTAINYNLSSNATISALCFVPIEMINKRNNSLTGVFLINNMS